MELEEVKKICLDLMETSKAAYLTTINSEGYPITRAMFNLRNKEKFAVFTNFFNGLDNIFEIYFSTNTSSSKTEHIKNNPKISVYYCNTDDFKGVMFGGEVEIIDDIELKKKIWEDWWIQYYPKGVNDPDYTLLRLKPKMAEFYSSLQKTQFKPGID